MNHRIASLMVVTAFLCAGAYAQNPPPDDFGPVIFQSAGAAMAGPGGIATANGGTFAMKVRDSGKAITGAPYTATASTETSQVLSDGNRIVNTSTASLARDSAGRTRREETMGMVGPWSVDAPKLVFIDDPAAQTNYVLDPNKQTATTMKFPGPNAMVVKIAGSACCPPADGANVVFKSKQLIGDPQDEAKTESLGTQTMEGVLTEGKRTTRTIPAGQIGNTQPIEITSEVWYSPDLQVVVMSKHHDPRMGDTTYQLTGITRGEPDHSLFEVPPGYTVKTMPAPPFPQDVPPGSVGTSFGLSVSDGPGPK